jgi:hypothetical protein
VATVRDIEHDGLGERRIEGFGRVLFLEHSDEERTVRLRRAEDETMARHDSGKSELLPEPGRIQLEFLEQRIVLAAARAELDRVAAIDLTAKVRAPSRPTNSLLGRLRTLFRNVMNEQTAQAALASLRTWCSDDETPQALKRNARDKLDRCEIGGVGLLQWLRRLAESGDGEAGWEGLVQASGEQATLTGLSAKSYLTTRDGGQRTLHGHSALLRVYLIDAVLGAMARLNRGGAR